MSEAPESHGVCSICGKDHPARGLVPAMSIHEGVAEQIRLEHADWRAKGSVCRADLNHFRSKYVQSLLQSERGDLTHLEHELVSSLSEYDLLVKNVDAELDEKWTVGERWADRIATFGGSWKFIGIFGAFLAAWVGVNTVALLVKPFDPYPFILLNLILSCIAAIQAPIIMMSQNRQEAKDRLRSQHDYQVNLKAELEIRHLHDKVDHLLSHQWERLAQIQKVQLEILSELSRDGSP
jgi:uncharacterized membrane protein